MKQLLINMWSKMTSPQNIYDTFYPFMIYSKTFMYFHSTPVDQDVIVTFADNIRFFLSITSGLIMLYVTVFVQLPMVLEDNIYIYGTYIVLFSASFTCLFAIIILQFKRVESHMVLNEINKLCLQLEKRNIKLSYKKLQQFGYILAIVTYALLGLGVMIFKLTIGTGSSYFYLILTWPASIYLQMLVHFLMSVNTVNSVHKGINKALRTLTQVSDKDLVIYEIQQIKRMHQLINSAIRYINSSLSIVVQPAFALIPFFLIYCCYVSVRILVQAKYDKFYIMMHYTYAAFFFMVFFVLISHYGNRTRQCKENLLKIVQKMIMTHYDNYQVTQLLVHFRYQIQQERSQIRFFTVPYDYTYLYAVSFFTDYKPLNTRIINPSICLLIIPLYKDF